MGNSAFKTTRRIRFSQCDPAGIAFYPKLVEGVNNTVEDWFERGVGFSFRKMHLEAKVGVPTCSISVTFENPARLGDQIEWSLSVLSLGRSSINLRVEAAHADGRRVLVADPSLVWCDLAGEGLQSRAIPEDLRSNMTGYLQQTGE